MCYSGAIGPKLKNSRMVKKVIAEHPWGNLTTSGPLGNYFDVGEAKFCELKVIGPGFLVGGG